MRRRRSHRLVPWSGRARALVVLVVVVIVRASTVVEVVEPAARLRPLQRRRPRGRVARRAGRRVGKVLARHVDDGADFGRGPRPPAQARLQAGTVVHSAERRRRPSSFPWSDLRALTTSCCTTPTPFGQLNTETGPFFFFFPRTIVTIFRRALTTPRRVSEQQSSLLHTRAPMSTRTSSVDVVDVPDVRQRSPHSNVPPIEI